MSTNDRDESFETLLRDALNDEADGVMPAGDGLARIQQRVAARKARLRWLRPTVALGSAATLALLAFGALVLVGHDDNDKVRIDEGNRSSEEPSAPTPSTIPATDKQFPDLAIFPFTTAAAERTWEDEYAAGASQWEAQPVDVATRWVADFLEEPSVDRVISQTPADGGNEVVVTLGRVLEGESPNPVAVTEVQLAKFGNAWIVTGATDPAGFLDITTPAAGASISSPVSVSGPSFGVDESLRVDVRDATSSTSYGTGTTSFGNGSGNWHVTVDFDNPTTSVGALVATDMSNADGGPARIAVHRVTLAPGSGSDVPQYFYAVKNDRITEFASRNGAAIRYLTAQEPGGGPSDPQLFGTDVYYLQGAGTCANALMAVPTSADQNASGSIAASPDNGYVITAYAVGETSIATFQSACDPARSPQAKLVTEPRGSGPKRHVIEFPSLPPTVQADPSFDVAGGTQLLTAVVRTGNQAYLARYDAYGDTSPTPNRNACPSYDVNDGMPAAVEVDQVGHLWFAVQTGSSMQVVRCDVGGGKSEVAFTVKGQDTPADVDVTRDGSAVLLTDADGKVWRWDGSGKPIQLTPSVPLTNVTW